MISSFFDTTKYVRPEEVLGEIPKWKKVAGEVWKIVWPAMLEAFLVALVIVFDGIMVSDLGNEAKAAVTITKQPIFLMISIITALNIAINALVSRRKGEGDIAKANNVVHASLVLSFSFSIILTLVFVVFSEPICRFMGSQDDTIGYASTYLRIIASGFVFNALRLTINACQRGIGNTKVSLITNIVANVVNIGLNYLLIMGNLGCPALGISGAAIATIVGNGVAFLICLYTIYRDPDYLKFSFRKLLHIDKEAYKSIFKILPSTIIEQAVMRIGFVIFAIIVNNLGTEATYVHGICNDLNSLVFTLSDGFALGTSAIIGHRLGEKRPDLAMVYAKVSMTISLFTCIIVCGFLVAFRNNLIMLYKPDSYYAFNLASTILILAAFITMPQNMQWVLTGVLRGSGDTKFTATSSLISIAIVRPIVSYALCYLTPLGLIGAWIGMFIDQLMRLTANFWRFRQRKWLKIKI